MSLFHYDDDAEAGSPRYPDQEYPWYVGEDEMAEKHAAVLAYEIAQAIEATAEGWALRRKPAVWGDSEGDAHKKRALELAQVFVPKTETCMFQVRQYRDLPLVIAVWWGARGYWDCYVPAPNGGVWAVDTYRQNAMQHDTGCVVGQASVRVATGIRYWDGRILVDLALNRAAGEILTELLKHRAPAA